MDFLQNSEFKVLSPDESTGIQGHGKSTAFPLLEVPRSWLSASLPAPYAEILPHVKRNNHQTKAHTQVTVILPEAPWATNPAK